MGKNVSQMEKGLKLNGLSAGRKGEKSIASKERIYLYHSGPFPIVFFLLPPSTPLFSLPVLYSSSGAVFPPLLSLFSPVFFCLSGVPLSAYGWWYECSRTPPLTDNSLDGTLLCTVQCTAILPQRGLDLRWMDRITPSAVSGTCQTEGGGSIGKGFLMWVDCTTFVLRKLGPTGISQVSISDMEQGCLCGLGLVFSAKMLYTAWDVSSIGVNHDASLCHL